MEGFAELSEGSEANRLQFLDGAQETRDGFRALLSSLVFFQQQIAELLFKQIAKLLFKAVEFAQDGVAVEVVGQFDLLMRFEIVAMTAQ